MCAIATVCVSPNTRTSLPLLVNYNNKDSTISALISIGRPVTECIYLLEDRLLRLLLLLLLSRWSLGLASFFLLW